MSALLPSAIRSVLENLGQGVSRNDLAKRSAAITAGYQKRLNSSEKLLSASDALSYALARMPATYAATRRALLHLKAATPELMPTSLLDVGCGPGTASFACHDVFPQMKEFQLLDRNGPFLDLARQLSTVALPIGAVDIMAQDITRVSSMPQGDLVIASYVLAELSSPVQAKLLHQLWLATKQALVLVEPGTPDGFQRLKEARLALITQGAFVAAPCTHEAGCAMADKNWCRFFERIQRSRDHRFLKSAERPFEDEPFSYLAVVRERPTSRAAARVIGKCVTNKFEIQLPICSSSGLSKLHIARRDKEKYQQNNDLQWGDTVLNLNQSHD
jgi:ribosomal protein RSM22 (predicted rRNA methylase)